MVSIITYVAKTLLHLGRAQDLVAHSLSHSQVRVRTRRRCDTLALVRQSQQIAILDTVRGQRLLVVCQDLGLELENLVLCWHSDIRFKNCLQVFDFKRHVCIHWVRVLRCIHNGEHDGIVDASRR